MENKKIGSATLMVLIVMTILLFIGGTALKTATMLHDLAMQRVRMQQQNQSAQALINYAIACCKLIHSIIEKKEIYEYTIDPWPHTSYRGEIEIELKPIKTLKKTGNPRWYEIKAQMIEDTNRVAQIS